MLFFSPSAFMIEFNGVFFPHIWFLSNAGHYSRWHCWHSASNTKSISNAWRWIDNEIQSNVLGPKKNRQQFMATAWAEKWWHESVSTSARSNAIACPVASTQIARHVYLYKWRVASIFTLRSSEENWTRHSTGGFCSYVSIWLILILALHSAPTTDMIYIARPAYGSMRCFISSLLQMSIHSARGNRLFRNLKSKAISNATHTCKSYKNRIESNTRG